MTRLGRTVLRASLVGLALCFHSPTASAAPQVDAGVIAAGCGRVHPERADFGFCLGLRSELFLLRERDRDWGLGPYVDVTTARFDELHLGAGVSVLAPLWPAVPFVLSVGPAFETSRSVPELTAALFWGPASYNFHSTYALANGLFVDASRALDGSATTRLMVGVRLDLLWVALPFVVAYEAVRH